jgi:hypothetical protein
LWFVKEQKTARLRAVSNSSCYEKTAPYEM